SCFFPHTDLSISTTETAMNHKQVNIEIKIDLFLWIARMSERHNAHRDPLSCEESESASAGRSIFAAHAACTAPDPGNRSSIVSPGSHPRRSRIQSEKACG